MPASVMVALLLPAVVPVAADEPNGFPHVWLDNGTLRTKVYLPAGEKSYYVAARFERSGFVARVEHAGHTFFGPWTRRNPRSHDHVMGTAGEFSFLDPPGFDEIDRGGTFYKIGVGALIRSETPRRDRKTGKMIPASYLFHRRYEIARLGTWKVTHGRTWVRCEQRFAGERGWGWHYVKRIELAEGDTPALTVRRTLRNVGRKTIDTDHYCHNFVRIDDEPIGPDYVVRFPFEIAPKEIRGDQIRIAGREIRFPAALEPGGSTWASLGGFSAAAAHHAFTVTHRGTGAEVTVSGDVPMTALSFWVTRTAACPEPFTAVRVGPGASVAWSVTYRFSAGGEPLLRRKQTDS